MMLVPSIIVFAVLISYISLYWFVGYIIDMLVNPEMVFLLRVWYIGFWAIACLWWIIKWFCLEVVYRRYSVWRKIQKEHGGKI